MLYGIRIHTAKTPLGLIYSEGLYSGAFGPDQNNPASVGKLDEGPIPPGNWQAIALTPDDPETGEYSIILAPDAVTELYVRSLGRDPFSFRIHGDDIANPGHGSKGCLVWPRFLRELFWESADHSLLVTL